MLDRRRGTHLERWHASLAPQIADARARLREMPVAQLARRSGCVLRDGALHMRLLWDAYAIWPATGAVRRVDGDAPPNPFTEALILSYLVTADGTRPSGQWIAYRELPNGMFYAQAFRGYAEMRLVRALGADGIERLRARAGQLGARPIAIGDAGFAFRVLPRVDLAIVYWLGDEDFPARTSVLFEDTAPHYMSTDGLAVLGSHLVGMLLDEK